MRAKIAAAMVVASGCWMSAGCNLVLGLDDPTPAGAGGTVTTGGAAGSGATTGAGGGGGATGTVCVPGATQPCKYSGDPATENVGACHAGAQTCNAEGTGYGACTGEVVPVKEICGNQEDEDCDGVSCGGTIWSKLWGDGDDQSVQYVETNDAGDVILAGLFQGALELNNPPLVSVGPRNYVAALSGAGVSNWGHDTDVNMGLSVHGDGQIALSRTTNGIGTRSWDAAGSESWAQVFGPGMGVAAADMTFATGSLLVATGTLGAQTNFDGTTLTPNGIDILLLGIERTSGTLSWARKFGGAGPQVPMHIAYHSSGRLFVSGIYSGTLANGAPDGNNDLFLTQLDEAMGFDYWSLGFAGNWYGHDLVVDQAGSAILAGRFSSVINFGKSDLISQGPADVYIAKFSITKMLAWDAKFGGPNFEPAKDVATSGAQVAVDSKGNILLTTRGKGTIDFGGGQLGSPGQISEFLVKLDSDGQHLWSRAFDPVGEAGGCAVAVAPNDEPILACTVQASSIDFGNGPLQGKGGLDVVVARFAP